MFRPNFQEVTIVEFFKDFFDKIIALIKDIFDKILGKNQ